MRFSARAVLGLAKTPRAQRMSVASARVSRGRISAMGLSDTRMAAIGTDIESRFSNDERGAHFAFDSTGASWSTPDAGGFPTLQTAFFYRGFLPEGREFLHQLCAATGWVREGG